MLFKWELIEKIVRGEKIQTRRPVKEGEVLHRIESPHGGFKPVAVVYPKHFSDVALASQADKYRVKIAIGKDYAVQYGRGKPTAYYGKYRGDGRMVREALPYEKYKKAFDKHGVMAGWYLEQRGYMPLRILITDIRREDVRDISLEDAEAEGFVARSSFWKVWCEFYDKSALPLFDSEFYLMDALKKRPDELYQAWAYTFEVV